MPPVDPRQDRTDQPTIFRGGTGRGLGPHPVPPGGSSDPSSLSSQTEVTPEELYRGSSQLVQEIVQGLCRRKNIPPADAEDLVQQAHLKLIDEDYRVLRQWNRRSSLKVYLATVITNLWRDQVRQDRGNPRLSAAARKLGPVAKELGRLLGAREGCTVDQAFELLKPRFPELTWAELDSLSQEIKAKAGRRFEGEETTMALPGAQGDETDPLVRQHGLEVKRKALTLMGRSLADLPEEDRLLLVRACAAEIQIARIARSLGWKQKPLYRRLDKRLRELRRKLEEAGIHWKDLREGLGIDESA